MDLIEIKVCNRCGIEKHFLSFSKDKDKKDGLRTICKQCSSLSKKIYYKENREHTLEKSSKYRLEYPDKVKKCKKASVEKKPEYYQQIKKNYYEENKSTILEKQKQYYEENKETILPRNRIYNQNNKDKKYKRHVERMKRDVNYKLAYNLRSRLLRAIKGNYKSGSAVRDLGCSINFLKGYLEVQFYADSETGAMMSWDNYGKGGWEIDHARPLSSFDLTNREQFLQAVHFSNLQPLWAIDNMRKGAKLNVSII